MQSVKAIVRERWKGIAKRRESVFSTRFAKRVALENMIKILQN